MARQETLCLPSSPISKREREKKKQNPLFFITGPGLPRVSKKKKSRKKRKKEIEMRHLTDLIIRTGSSAPFCL